MKHHHNTTNESGSTLDKLEAKAKQQEKIILELFQSTKEELTPFDVSALTGGIWPIQSVRRSITNLTTYGYLEKTTHLKTGGYGRRNYAWKLRDKNWDGKIKTKLKDLYELEKKSCELLKEVNSIQFSQLLKERLQHLKDFQQLELKFAEVTTDNEKLKEANQVCHEEIEKQRKQIMQKNYEIEKLYNRIDELTKVKK
jgi:hypothetical protein